MKKIGIFQKMIFRTLSNQTTGYQLYTTIIHILKARHLGYILAVLYFNFAKILITLYLHEHRTLLCTRALKKIQKN